MLAAGMSTKCPQYRNIFINIVSSSLHGQRIPRCRTDVGLDSAFSTSYKAPVSSGAGKSPQANHKVTDNPRETLLLPNLRVDQPPRPLATIELLPLYSALVVYSLGWRKMYNSPNGPSPASTLSFDAPLSYLATIAPP